MVKVRNILIMVWLGINAVTKRIGSQYKVLILVKICTCVCVFAVDVCANLSPGSDKKLLGW